MKENEDIPVFVRIEKGKTVCICHADDKHCQRNCERVSVQRNRFKGWQSTMKRNRYGQ